MRGLIFSVLAFAAAACQSQIPHGTGPVTIQANVQRAFQKHLGHDLPVVFLVGDDGATSYAMHCPHHRCDPDPLYVLAQRRCLELTGKPCRVFAEYGKITWQGPVAYASPPGGVMPLGMPAHDGRPTEKPDAHAQPPATFEEPLPHDSKGGNYP